MPEVTREEFLDLKRIVEDHTARLSKGDTAMAVINEQLRQINEKLEELSLGVKTLQEKPARKWETISTTVVQWIVTALLAYIAVKMGLA